MIICKTLIFFSQCSSFFKNQPIPMVQALLITFLKTFSTPFFDLKVDGTIRLDGAASYWGNFIFETDILSKPRVTHFLDDEKIL
jgi:hypothetical protein